MHTDLCGLSLLISRVSTWGCLSVQRWVDGFTPEAQHLDNFKKNVEALPAKNLLVIITTDKGLCGGAYPNCYTHSAGFSVSLWRRGLLWAG